MNYPRTENDFCSWGIIGAVAWFAGRKAEQHLPRFRLALRWIFGVAFLATLVVGYNRIQPQSGQELLTVVLIGYLIAQAAELVFALVLPVVDWVWVRLDRSWSEQRRETERQRHEELEAEQREAEAQRLAEENERLRPERERQVRAQAARRAAEASAQLRRDHALSECFYFYMLHEPEIKTRFPRERYDEYVRTYLRDSMPPEEVEEQARKLHALMESHVKKSGAALEPMDVTALATWYKEMKAQIEAQPVDERAKRVHVAKLTMRYTELMQEHLDGLKP